MGSALQKIMNCPPFSATWRYAKNLYRKCIVMLAHSRDIFAERLFLVFANAPEAASVDLGHEACVAAEAFDIARLAPDDAALLDLFRGEDVVQPEVGIEGGVVCLHLGSVGEGWLMLGELGWALKSPTQLDTC